MKHYPDPDKFFEQHLEQAAQKRIRGMKRAGFPTISHKLLNRLIERDIEEGRERLIEEGLKVLEHNIQVYVRSCRRERNRRTRARVRLWVCPPVVVASCFMAWYSFGYPGTEGVIMGTVYVAGALIFLGILVLGAIFDRPTVATGTLDPANPLLLPFSEPGLQIIEDEDSKNDGSASEGDDQA